MSSDRDTYCLLYVSTASRPLDEADMNSILEVSREKNKSADITGLLLYSREHFIQVLEGTEANVHETFARIKADPRHQNVTTMIEDKVKKRFFTDWSMAYRKVTESDTPVKSSLDEILAQRESGTLKAVRKMFEIFQYLESSAE